jgi:hypothetical protein
MNNRLAFRPDLVDCVLEERVAPAIANLGLIILTTSGYSLIIPFPGANTSAAGSLGSSGPSGGTASAVSGVPIPTSLYVTGSNGISSLRPGNITGVPSLAAAAAAGGLTVSIQVGSGAEDASNPATNPTATPTGGAVAINPGVGATAVGDPTQRPALTQIGTTTSGSDSPVLPPGQSYHDSAPVAAAPSLNVVPQSMTSGPGGGTMSGSMYDPNPQMGAPTLGPSGGRGGMNNPLGRSLVPVTPMLPGNN